MLAIQKWTERKPFLIAMLAPQIAITARDIHEAFQDTKERRFMSHQFPLPNLPAWFAMYRSHKKPLHFLRTLFDSFSEFGADSIEFGEGVLAGAQELSRNKQVEVQTPSLEELEQMRSVMQNMLSESFQEIQDDISTDPLDPSLKSEMLSLLADNSLESSFFILITAPCWLIYRISPTRLYRKARQGNVESLEKLLQLDPLMLHDPAIGKAILKLRFNHKKSKYEKIILTPLSNPNANITALNMKYAIGGLISALAKALNPLHKHKVSTPDIHKLFDAVAKDFDGLETDTDLPENQDSFARAIYRYRDEWLKVFLPDKKK